jgi:hypothetical protein
VKANIITDPHVKNFNAKASLYNADDTTLETDEEHYRQFLLKELFSFQDFNSLLEPFPDLKELFNGPVFDVADKIESQLYHYAHTRIEKAAAYFLEQINSFIQSTELVLQKTALSSKKVAQRADAVMDRLLKKAELMKYFSENTFSITEYISQNRKERDRYQKFSKAVDAHPHEPLLNDLAIWRKEIASTEKVIPSMVLSDQTLNTIASKQPMTLKALGAIKGVGGQKSATYGQAILTYIRNYQNKQSGAIEQASLF